MNPAPQVLSRPHRLAGFPPASRLGGLPRADAVAAGIAGLLVLGVGVQRLAVVGPLQGAVAAGDQAPFAAGLGVLLGDQRRPDVGAFLVAVGLAFLVLAVGVERQPLGIHQAAVLDAGRFRGLGAARQGEQRQQGGGAD